MTPSQGPRRAPPARPRRTRENFFFSEAHLRSLGIRAVGAGRCQRAFRARHPIVNRRMHLYVFILITRGASWFESASSARRTCREGDGFVLFPGEPHGYGLVPGSDFEETWIAFDGPAITEAEREGILDRGQPVYPAIGTRTRELLERAFLLSSSREIAAQRRLPAIVHETVIELDRRESRTGNAVPPELERIRRELCDRACDRIDLRELARRHGMSYSSLRARFRQTFGLPPGRYHIVQKMNQACALLYRGSSVAETSYAVGIEDPYYFSRIFRRTIGKSPREFARRLGHS